MLSVRLIQVSKMGPSGKSVKSTGTKPTTHHYNDIIMGAIASQITSLTIVYSTVYSVADQRKHQSSASLAFMRGIHGWPVNSAHKWPVTQKMFPFDDVIMILLRIVGPETTTKLEKIPIGLYIGNRLCLDDRSIILSFHRTCEMNMLH